MDAMDGPVLMCACCGRMGDHTRACLRCLDAHYCSDACQRTHLAIHRARECSGAVAAVVRDAMHGSARSTKGRRRVRETTIAVELHHVKVAGQYPTLLGNAWVKKLGAPAAAPAGGGAGAPVRAATAERTPAGTKVRDMLRGPAHMGRRAAAAVGPGAPYVAPVAKLGRWEGTASHHPSPAPTAPPPPSPTVTAAAVAASLWSADAGAGAGAGDEGDDPTVLSHTVPAVAVAAGGECGARAGEMEAPCMLRAAVLARMAARGGGGDGGGGIGTAVGACLRASRTSSGSQSDGGEADEEDEVPTVTSSVVAAAMEGEEGDEVTGLDA
jgi:hypothetical protein